MDSIKDTVAQTAAKIERIVDFTAFESNYADLVQLEGGNAVIRLEFETLDEKLTIGLFYLQLQQRAAPLATSFSWSLPLPATSIMPNFRKK